VSGVKVAFGLHVVLTQKVDAKDIAKKQKYRAKILELERQKENVAYTSYPSFQNPASTL